MFFSCSLQECVYSAFENNGCLIRFNPAEPLEISDICYIVVNAFHGRRHAAILKFTLIMVRIQYIKLNLQTR